MSAIHVKPDKLNGKLIGRPVHEGSVLPGVFFPPSVSVALPTPVMIEQLVEESMQGLVTISDQTSPEMRAQALTAQAKLKKHQTVWMVRAALNERAHMIRHLERLGLTDAAKALRDA